MGFYLVERDRTQAPRFMTACVERECSRCSTPIYKWTRCFRVRYLARRKGRKGKGWNNTGAYLYHHLDCVRAKLNEGNKLRRQAERRFSLALEEERRRLGTLPLRVNWVEVEDIATGEHTYSGPVSFQTGPKPRRLAEPRC